MAKSPDDKTTGKEGDDPSTTLKSETEIKPDPEAEPPEEPVTTLKSGSPTPTPQDSKGSKPKITLPGEEGPQPSVTVPTPPKPTAEKEQVLKGEGEEEEKKKQEPSKLKEKPENPPVADDLLIRVIQLMRAAVNSVVSNVGTPLAAPGKLLEAGWDATTGLAKMGMGKMTKSIGNKLGFKAMENKGQQWMDEGVQGIKDAEQDMIEGVKALVKPLANIGPKFFSPWDAAEPEKNKNKNKPETPNTPTPPTPDPASSNTSKLSTTADSDALEKRAEQVKKDSESLQKNPEPGNKPLTPNSEADAKQQKEQVEQSLKAQEEAARIAKAEQAKEEKTSTPNLESNAPERKSHKNN